METDSSAANAALSGIRNENDKDARVKVGLCKTEGTLQGNSGYNEHGAMLRTITGALSWRRANGPNIKILSVSLPV